jgi:hypothetical protein
MFYPSTTNTYQQNIHFNMSRKTVTADIVLQGQSNWELWIVVVKRIAKAGDVWEYIDPNQVDEW